MNNTTLTPKQNLLIDSLNREDKLWLTTIVFGYKTDPFIESFPMHNVDIAKQSFFRLFLLRELDYEVLTYETFESEMMLTLKIS